MLSFHLQLHALIRLRAILKIAGVRDPIDRDELSFVEVFQVPSGFVVWTCIFDVAGVRDSIDWNELTFAQSRSILGIKWNLYKVRTWISILEMEMSNTALPSPAVAKMREKNDTWNRIVLD